MTASLNKYDVVVVKFPFASSIKYKARPAVIISTDFYQNHSRDTVIILAITGQTDTKLDFEPYIADWQISGLLKPSVLKSAVATVEKSYILAKLGMLSEKDQTNLNTLLENICFS